MSSEYRHTDFEAMLSTVTTVRQSYRWALFFLTVFLVMNVAVVSAWLSPPKDSLVPGYILLPSSFWTLWCVYLAYKARKVFVAMKMPLYLAFEGLKDSEIYSQVMIDLWDVQILDLYGVDKVKVTPVLEHTVESGARP